MSWIPKEELQAVCSTFAGKCGLYVSLPFANETFAFQAEEPMKAASTIKIPLLALLFKDAEEGRVDLSKTLSMDPVNRVRGSGILKFLSPDIRISLYDYAVLMMIVSDNAATNQVIDTVEIRRANAYFAENGWNATQLNKKLFIPAAENPLGIASANFTSAADLGRMLEAMLAGKLVSESASRRMMSIMACQQLGKFDQSLPGVLRPGNTTDPLGEVPPGRVMLVQKGGTLRDQVSHDAAIMLLPNGRHAVMVMMTECTDGSASLEAIKQVSRLVYDRLIRQ